MEKQNRVANSSENMSEYIDIDTAREEILGWLLTTSVDEVVDTVMGMMAEPEQCREGGTQDAEMVYRAVPLGYISVEKYAEKCGLSKVTVRKAIRILEQKGATIDKVECTSPWGTAYRYYNERELDKVMMARREVAYEIMECKKDRVYSGPFDLK